MKKTPFNFEPITNNKINKKSNLISNNNFQINISIIISKMKNNN